jgi:hypothetical protein
MLDGIPDISNYIEVVAICYHLSNPQGLPTKSVTKFLSLYF